ncbi:EamA family transporter [Denitratisoma sp. agr-D3]
MGGRLVYGWVALAAVLWGANFNLSKPIVAEMSPLTAAAARFLIAALLMVVLVLIQGQRLPLRRHAKPYALLGLVGIGGFNLLFFFGMQSTSAVNGALIMASNPLVTTLLAFLLLGERPTRRHWLAFPFAMAGVAFVLLGGGQGLRLAMGDWLMLGANLSWALYNVLAKRWMPKDVPGLANTAGVMVAGAVVLTLAAVACDAPPSLPGATALEALLTMAVAGSVLAYLFWNAGLAQLGAGRTSLFLNLVPVSAMIIAALGGQPPSPVQLFGGLVVLAAVTAALLPARQLAVARA